MPSTLKSERERREYVLSFGLVAALQFAIAISLAVAAAQTYRMWQQNVPYLPAQVQRAMPLALMLGAGIACLAGLRTVAGIRRLRRGALEPGPGDRG
jgi:hypothetical protein